MAQPGAPGLFPPPNQQAAQIAPAGGAPPQPQQAAAAAQQAGTKKCSGWKGSFLTLFVLNLLLGAGVGGYFIGSCRAERAVAKAMPVTETGSLESYAKTSCPGGTEKLLVVGPPTEASLEGKCRTALTIAEGDKEPVMRCLASDRGLAHGETVCAKSDKLELTLRTVETKAGP